MKADKSRAEKAGRAMSLAIIEMVHLMYQNNTARNFWKGFFEIFKELKYDPMGIFFK